MKPTKVMVVIGTRPEAIKMAPVVQAVRAHPALSSQVVVTAQHRQMLDQVLALFDIVPDIDLDIMRANQTLPDIGANILHRITPHLDAHKPDIVLVHGDTSTTLYAALAAFYARIPVGHVEAGLRTGNMQAPWPEEMNRRLTTSLAAVHFAPTIRSRDNLLREGIKPAEVHVTGNTVIDALLATTARIHSDAALRLTLQAQFEYLQSGKRTLLVTGHRRENFGRGFEQICNAIKQLSTRVDLQIVYPVHLNPNVQQPVNAELGGLANVHLVAPLDYLPFVYLMQRCDLILTDSGGIQEEAPSLNKPVLVMREATERPEALAAGAIRLVGNHPGTIISEVNRLLDDQAAYDSMCNLKNAYGDGMAAKRIADIIASYTVHAQA